MPASELAAKLDHYLSADDAFRSTYHYVRQRLTGTPALVAHNWEHTYRDILNSLIIGEAEGADMRIVLPAMTMHDIGFLYGASGKTHGAVGADNLRAFMAEGGIAYPDDMAGHIADCIRTHKGSMHDEQPATLEAKVVADADLLEKFGPFGVYQTIRTFSEFNMPLQAIIGRESVFAGLRLETDTGRRLAEPGRQYVLDFFAQLRDAAEPYGTTPSGA